MVRLWLQLWLLEFELRLMHWRHALLFVTISVLLVHE
jgi:hypothetical protein